MLELKLLADVGLVGFPNVGKSSIISVVSAAKPKIADYHFTTIDPNLGVVRLEEEESFVLVDIPGLVEGAGEGVGLDTVFASCGKDKSPFARAGYCRLGRTGSVGGLPDYSAGDGKL